MADDPLACRRCGHRIESHEPGDYLRDVCVGAGRNPCTCPERPCRRVHGVGCRCTGFTILIEAPHGVG